MLNYVLAIAAAVFWTTAYVWYWAPNIRGWWQRRKQRRARAP